MKNKNVIGISPMTLVLAALLIFMSTGIAMATVWTDQADYSPGSIVTISGDKSDGAGYLAGETVNVSVNGPYQYDSKCSGTADENGAWSCQITLSADYTAEGSYTYTAVGQTSGMTQSGTFLDAASNVNFATSGLPSGVSVGVTYSGTNNGGHPISGTQTFASPGPSADIGTLTGSLFTYSFPTSINTGGITYSMVSSSPSNPFNTASGKTRVIATYAVADNTPPVIAPSVSGTLGSNGWYISDVTVSWTVSDPESAITFSSGCGGTTISTDTTGITLTCSATSTGGTSSQSVTIKRDATSPTVSASPDRYADHNGWYNSKVIISFTGTDASPGSGIDSCDPSVDYSLDSATASVSGTCKDKAGNVGTGTFNFKYDGTSPTITASASPSPASTGWYNIATGIPTVSFTCSDATSDLTGPCPDSVTLGEGVGQSVSRTISDSAGNSASATVGGINVDLTKPTLSFGTATPEQNTAGWNNADVSVPFTPDDTLSGIASTSPSSPLVLASEGYAVTGTVTVIDNAGNSETFTSPAFKIDKTKPTITGSRTPLPNANDWNNVDVTVHFACDDGLSGISSCTSDTIVSTEEVGQSVTGTAIDQAGNTESTTVGDINIDKTSPTITASASTSDGIYTSGTWTNKDVTVSFSCSDDRSGVASCDSSVTKSGEGAGQSATGSVTDKAGNTVSATFSGINIDKSVPAITVSVPNDGASYALNQPVVADYSCVDSLSGVATCSGNVPSGSNIDTNSVGAKTFTVNTVDNAGNSGTKSVTYYVKYVFGGILQPINVDGSSIFKFGSTVPVKFQLKDYNGNYVSTAVATISMAKIDNNVEGTYIEAISTSAATTGNLFRYDATSNQYIFNLATKPLSTGTWNIKISINDGMTYNVKISLK